MMVSALSKKEEHKPYGQESSENLETVVLGETECKVRDVCPKSQICDMLKNPTVTVEVTIVG
jgi:hypothetical protein